MIMIRRFEAKEMEKGKKFEFSSKDGHSVFIKDHTTDKIVGFISLENKLDKNMELAELIIETIEDYVDRQ